MKKITIDGLAHVGVFVKDLQVSKKFYTEKLDFLLVQETSLPDPDGLIQIAFIQNGNLVIELVQFPKTAAKKDGPVDHIAIHVDNIEDVHTELKNRGIVFETQEIVFGAPIGPKGAKWITFRGPDNEHLELNEVL
jgi:Lactoylglutathione lyase and related lyases